MTIAIDFDKTWTADPALWRKFYNDCVERGHKVIIATARRIEHGNEDMDRHGLPAGIPIVFSNHDFKRPCCEREGYMVDIWIDDTPSMIDQPLLINPDSSL